MQEYDLRAVAKNNAEYITPLQLRKFLAKKINKQNISVLEPAIGSGQLLFEAIDSIASIDGYDINKLALDTAYSNFKGKATCYNEDFILCNVTKKYDFAIANYPFSLKPTDLQKEHIACDSFLSGFFVDNSEVDLLGNCKMAKPSDIKGVLDFVFILKSFNLASEGLYFCFPGIGYRAQEKKYREYLIKNKFIKEYGLLKNCKFDHTTISIFFLHLTKEPNEATNSFSLDFKTGELINKPADFEDSIFTIPHKEAEKEHFNAVEAEIKAREDLILYIKKEIDFSKKIYELDDSIKENLTSIEDFKKEIIKNILAL